MAPPHKNNNNNNNNQPNPLHLSLPPLPLSLSTKHHRRCSKAQMCFFNILHIISSFPTPNVKVDKLLTHDDDMYVNKEFVEDTVGENCVFVKNDIIKRESESAVEDDRVTEYSGISHVEDQSSGIAIDYNGASEQQVIQQEKEQEQGQQDVKVKLGDEGNLSLLIEAAQLILGGLSEPDKKAPSQSTEPRIKNKNVERNSMGKGGAKKKQQCWTAATEAEWYAEFEDTSPVVRSKRGRNQVLPFKYRDSVVEPLVRWSSSCKSSSNVVKRRSK